MKKKILIVEDEPIIAEDIKYSLEDAGYKVVGQADNADDALLLIKKMQPDLIILDINLNRALDGVQIAAIIKQDFQIPFIFLTAFVDRESRERAKKTEPYAYLIKPFNDAALEMAVELAFDRYYKEQQEQKPQNSSLEKDVNGDFFVKTGNQEFHRLSVETIDYIEAYDIYSYIHSGPKKILVNLTLKDIESKLNHPTLLRIHRSFIVNLKKIESLKGNLVIVPNREIPIGGTYKEVLFEKLKLI